MSCIAWSFFLVLKETESKLNQISAWIECLDLRQNWKVSTP